MTGRALYAAPAALRALVDGAEGTVVFAFLRAAYVRLGDDWLLLAEPTAPFGPLSLVVDRLSTLELRVGAPVRVSERRLHVGEAEIGLERTRRRATVRAAVGPRADPDAIAAAAASAAAALPRPPEILEPGLEALRAHRIDDGVAALAGRGEGLTPAGDDVLAGYAAARVTLDCWAGDPMSVLAASRASPLGLAYLRCAEHGELPVGAALLLAAIHRGAADEAASVAPRVGSWGATSGVAIAWGISAAASRAADACSTTAPSRAR
jgi:hypothetical protein